MGACSSGAERYSYKVDVPGSNPGRRTRETNEPINKYYKLMKNKRKIVLLGRKYKLDLMILHGSKATGKVLSPEPDVDVAIYRKGGIESEEYLKIYSDLLGVFGDSLDLKTLHKKDALFLYLAMRDSVLLYGDERFYSIFKVYAYRRYMEAKPLFKLQDFLIAKRLERLKRRFL